MHDRKDGIGASEIHLIYDDPMALYLLKAGIIEDSAESEAAWLGTNFEPVMDKRYFKETGLMPMQVEPIIHPTEPWRRCSPDRLVKKNGAKILLEYKTTGYHNDWGSPGSDEVPFRVATQVQWQLSLMPDVNQAEVPVYFFAPRREFAIYKMERNEEVIDNLVEAARDFWLNHVIPRIPPEIDASPASQTLLRHLYPDSKGEVLPAPDSAMDWRLVLNKANARLKFYEEQKKLAQHHLEALVGDADSLLWSDGWKFTWRKQKDRMVVDWEALAMSFLPSPDQLNRFTTVKPGIRIPRLYPPPKGK